jgi:hypothetical protein
MVAHLNWYASTDVICRDITTRSCYHIYPINRTNFQAYLSP